MLNNAGHYRQVARYSTQAAAVKAAQNLNAQSDESFGTVIINTLGAL